MITGSDFGALQCAPGGRGGECFTGKSVFYIFDLLCTDGTQPACPCQIGALSSPFCLAQSSRRSSAFPRQWKPMARHSLKSHVRTIWKATSPKGLIALTGRSGMGNCRKSNASRGTVFVIVGLAFHHPAGGNFTVVACSAQRQKFRLCGWGRDPFQPQNGPRPENAPRSNSRRKTSRGA